MGLTKRETGEEMERLAERDLLQKFDQVEPHEKWNDFYDYLGYIEDRQYYIEVKYRTIRHKSGHFQFSMNQVVNLLKQDNFLIYLMTNKANKFVTEKEFLENSHVHYNEKNPDELYVFLRARYDGDELELMRDANCRLCEGTLKNWISDKGWDE